MYEEIELEGFENKIPNRTLYTPILICLLNSDYESINYIFS
jgi:hypothetical protein